MVALTKEESFRHALTQPGGGRQIMYRDLVVVGPIDGIKEALQLISKTSDRAKMMVRVNAAITNSYPRLRQLSDNEMMELCQDIVIWFANEIFEGRERLTETIN